MKSKITSTIPISTFSVPLPSVAMSNKARRENTLIKALGITGLSILILVGVAGAAPFAYVSNYDSNNISVIDITTNKVTATVDVGDHPAGVAVSPDGKKAYVVNAGSDTVSIINTTTNEVTATVNVGDTPRGVAVSLDGKKVYVAIQSPDSLTGAVNIIDIATNKVTATVPVGKAPGGIEVTPDGTKVYVVNYASHAVSIIDTATEKVTDTVKVGKYPTGIAIGPFIGSSMTDQSTRAISNVTEDIGIEETNLSLSKVKNVVLLNNSNNSDSESDNSDSSSGNESSKNNSTPGFGLLGGLTSLYGGWKLRKKLIRDLH